MCAGHGRPHRPLGRGRGHPHMVATGTRPTARAAHRRVRPGLRHPAYLQRVPRGAPTQRAAAGGDAHRYRADNVRCSQRPRAQSSARLTQSGGRKDAVWSVLADDEEVGMSTEETVETAQAAPAPSSPRPPQALSTATVTTFQEGARGRLRLPCTPRSGVRPSARDGEVDKDMSRSCRLLGRWGGPGAASHQEE